MQPNELEKQFLSRVIEDLVEYGIQKAVGPKATEGFYTWTDKHLDDAVPAAEAHSGCTKGVFVLPDCDWVIKIPLGSKDYCSIEADIFKAAEQEGLAKFFAACYFFEERNGVKFYIQERAECDPSAYHSIFYKAAENYYCEYRCDYENSEDYRDAVYDYAEDYDGTDAIEAVFGYEEKLNKFLFDDHHLNDFHSGNFGYICGRGDVLTDYSGY